ncbi:MAG: hypothetical protein NTZ19_13090 [Bacteroidetes bacterium]|nr:hypothetical protein [Bacteroidota bacterium]
MDINLIIESILMLPNKYYSSNNNLSIKDLLLRTNYLEVEKDINYDYIYQCLIKHPEYANSWLTYSENKRSNFGWFIELNDNSNYSVGYFDSKLGKMKENNYDNLISACAFFVVKEIIEIAEM